MLATCAGDVDRHFALGHGLFFPFGEISEHLFFPGFPRIAFCGVGDKVRQGFAWVDFVPIVFGHPDARIRCIVAFHTPRWECVGRYENRVGSISVWFMVSLTSASSWNDISKPAEREFSYSSHGLFLPLGERVKRGLGHVFDVGPVVE